MPHYNLPHNHGQKMASVLEKMPAGEDFQSVAEIFSGLGDSSRLRILWLLCHCEECTYNIAAAFGMSNPAASHHLRILKNSGLITSRRSGKEVYYTLADTPEARLLHKAVDSLFHIKCAVPEQLPEDSAFLVPSGLLVFPHAHCTDCIQNCNDGYAYVRKNRGPHGGIPQSAEAQDEELYC